MFLCKITRGALAEDHQGIKTKSLFTEETLQDKAIGLKTNTKPNCYYNKAMTGLVV